jgi:hypothetical protein
MTIILLNGIPVATIEGQNKSHIVVLKHGLKEFIFGYVKKFSMCSVIDGNAMGFIYLDVHP